jgi:Rrf2 family nitric oxide-sensitive transcriptional repressor
MKLTGFTDYCLRVLIYLAAEPSRRATVAEIAKSFDVSERHLTKAVHHLGKHGWIATIRGKGGGMTLAREPQDICIGAVVRDAEGAVVPAECFANDGGGCRIASCCRLKRVLAQALHAFYAALDGYTLADIAGNRQMLGEVLMIHAA